MAKATYFASRKGQAFQAAIAAEANADAGVTWGAPEATLANSLKGKINLALVALRSSKVITVGGAGKFFSFGGLKARVALANVTDEATANADATYGQPEADLLNSMKTKVNAILATMRSAKIIGGRARFVFIHGQKGQFVQPDIADITIANADATYTSGGAGEQGLANDIKTKLNLILVALRNAKVILP